MTEIPHETPVSQISPQELQLLTREGMGLERQWEKCQQDHFHDIYVDWKKSIVLDIDQTLIDNLPRLHRMMSITGKIFHWEDIPNLKDIFSHGGTYAAYAHIPGARDFNDRLNGSPWLYKNNLVLPGAVEGVKAITNHVFRPVAYLTARPESLKEQSLRELIALGFPELPLIAKPREISMYEVGEWKLTHLDQISKRLNTPVIMIDDSINMAKTILRGQYLNIKPVVFCGPLTDPAQVPDGAMLADWASMLGIIEHL